MANYFKVNSHKKKPLAPLTILIERLDHQGRGVGFYQKKPVFVFAALAQELVKIQMTEQKNKFSKAKLLDVVKPSEVRVLPQCKHFGQCGGCDLQHLEHHGQLAFKQQKLTELFHRQNILQNLPWQTPITGNLWHYRRKARIGVQFDKNGQAIIGFRRQATNQLQAIKHCPVLVQPLSDIFIKLNRLVSQLTVAKSIGHIEVISSHSVDVDESDATVVTLVIRQLKPLNVIDQQLWQVAAHQHNWQVAIDNGERTVLLNNALLNKSSLNDLVEKGSGKPALHYPLHKNIIINFGCDDFIQVNATINQQMITQAMDWLALCSSDVVLDLFCGLGNFSLPIAQQTSKVVGVEGVDNMVKQASINANLNNITNVSFFQSDLNATWHEQKWTKLCYTKAILDPARAGALNAVAQLITFKIAKILYISCDPTTLAIDSKQFLLAGYKITKIGVLDMFTHTKHSETMVLFEQ